MAAAPLASAALAVRVALFAVASAMEAVEDALVAKSKEALTALGVAA
jgi:hypothetical protein